MLHMLLVCSCFHSLQTCSFCILINYVTAGKHQQVSRILHGFLAGGGRWWGWGWWSVKAMFMVSIGISVTIQKSHILFIIVINNYGTDTFLLALQMKIAKKYIFQMSGVLAKRFFLTIVAPGRMLVSGTWLISRTFHIIFLWLIDCCQNPTC